jgi:hypothetical protein
MYVASSYDIWAIETDKPFFCEIIRRWVRVFVMSEGQLFTRYGIVEDADPKTFLMSVFMDDTQTIEQFNYYLPASELVFLEIMSADDAAKINREIDESIRLRESFNQLSKKDEETLDLISTSKPGIENAVGCYVRQPKSSSTSVAREGIVKFVDHDTRLLTVILTQTDKLEYFQVSIDDSNLQWFRINASDVNTAKKIFAYDFKSSRKAEDRGYLVESDEDAELEKPESVTVNRPPIEESKGWRIKFQLPAADGYPSGGFLYKEGVVFKFDASTHEIAVSLDSDKSVLELNYENPRIEWVLRVANDGNNYDDKFDFSNPVLRPSIEDAINGYYVKIVAEGQSSFVAGKVVGVNSIGKKKNMRIQTIRDGELINEFHDGIPYAYKDPKRMLWFRTNASTK